MSRNGRLSCVMVLLSAFLLVPSYARADDGTWVTVGAAGFSAGWATRNSLAFQPSTNQPYVAYGDSANGGKITVERFDGTNWITVGAAGFSAGWVDHLSLAFDPATSQPYVAYGSGGNPGGKVTVKRFDGANWVTVGTAGFNAGGWTHGTSLAFDPSTDQPYVAYTESTFNGVKATVMRFDGANWVTVGPSAGFSSEADVSLAFDLSTHQPYVAYQDRDSSHKVTVKRFDGANWVTIGAAGFSAWVADYISLAFDPATNQPYVAYRDRGNGFRGASCASMARTGSRSVPPASARCRL
jgi:hypothetical protein